MTSLWSIRLLVLKLLSLFTNVISNLGSKAKAWVLFIPFPVKTNKTLKSLFTFSLQLTFSVLYF